MFELTAQEDGARLRTQIVTSKQGRGGRRTRPYAFTEQGVAMLSSVLRSARAVAVNVEIMRAFVRLRTMLAGGLVADKFHVLRLLNPARTHRRAEVTTGLTNAITVCLSGPASSAHSRVRRATGTPSGIRGGATGDRTPDLCIANAALSQLSYCPKILQRRTRQGTAPGHKRRGRYAGGLRSQAALPASHRGFTGTPSRAPARAAPTRRWRRTGAA